ncbi:MAG: hypothetical protein U5M51_00295 [Emticicia sp.]|nr:hypothetical protein [Emticicia sp.]
MPQTTEEIIDLVFNRSEIPTILEKIQARYSEEQKKREEFYNWVTADVKAEFIKGEIIVHSPVRSQHAMVSDNVLEFFSIYALKTYQGGRVTTLKSNSRGSNRKRLMSQM